VQQSSAAPIPVETEPALTTGHPFADPLRPERRVPVEVLKARIRRYNGDLEPTSEAFGAALVLISGAEYGHNIDQLARRTGLSRAFVARCARRLIDNGVWHGGRTVAEWEPRDPASGTFWNDVAVAEGKMCRRVRPDGSLEWAPAGFWNKNFHFLDPEAEGRLGNQYLDSAPEAPAVEPAESDLDVDLPAESDFVLEAVPYGNGNGVMGSPESTGEEAPVAEAIPADDLSTGRQDPSSREGAEDDEPGVDLEDPVPSLRHVFRDAVWLG